MNPTVLNANFGEVAPGVFRFQLISGMANVCFDLPTDSAEALFKRALVEIEKVRRRIVVAPPGAIGGRS